MINKSKFSKVKEIPAMRKSWIILTTSLYWFALLILKKKGLLKSTIYDYVGVSIIIQVIHPNDWIL